MPRRIVKVAAPIAAFTATYVVWTLSKGKIGKMPANQIADVTYDVVAGFSNNPEKMFGGLTQSTLDGLARATNRGVRAVVDGDVLRFVYKSASGKSTNAASFSFDDAGKLIARFGNGPYWSANSPRFFLEKILEARKTLE